jgi:hypothetical protein
MPILNGGGGKSSPSIIEYNFSEGRTIQLNPNPQKIIGSAPSGTQRSFWVYFSEKTLLSGDSTMQNSLPVPKKFLWEFSDNGGEKSDWWASSLENDAVVKIQIKSNLINQGDTDEITTDIFEYTALGDWLYFGADSKVSVKYVGTNSTENISISNQSSLIGLSDFNFMIYEINKVSDEEIQINYDNIVESIEGQTIQFHWNCETWPFLAIVLSDGEWTAAAKLLFSGKNVSFVEFIHW